MLLFTLQMDAVDGMARADGEEFDPNLDTDYSSGLDNVHTHWENPMRPSHPMRPYPHPGTYDDVAGAYALG